jgi:hypothetical protein
VKKEPRYIDLSTKSEPWTETELSDFRKLMQEIKEKNNSMVRTTKSLKNGDKIRLKKTSKALFS